MKNFSYTLSSNLITMILSILVILIVPKFISVEEYGYWQLYIFYSSYVGFLHFGWNDGIYLRYGGKEYQNLNKELFFSQFWTLFFSQLFIAVIILSVAFFFYTDVNKFFIIKMTVLCMLLVNARIMLIYILQATNRIKNYAQITMLEKVFYCILIIAFLIVGIKQFEVLVTADLLGKFVSLLFAAYCCRDIVMNKITAFYFDLKEIYENISVGVKLMFANLASMFIVGTVRFGIEHTWSVETFGKLSMIINISNFMLIFINAMGIILFPILRRTQIEKLPIIYTTARSFLMFLLFGLLIAYYPLKVILSSWLPEYAESLIYMAILFPMCVYEGKMILLINTYLKTLRKEKLILSINLASVALSVILTILFTIIIENLSLAVLSIVLLLAFRCILAEYFLSKILGVSVSKDTVIELSMTVIFIITGWFSTPWIGLLLYLISYGLYLLIQRVEIKRAFMIMKQLLK